MRTPYALVAIDGTVELWLVRGLADRVYTEKMEAEKAARAAFPDDNAAHLYGRISYRIFSSEVTA